MIKTAHGSAWCGYGTLLMIYSIGIAAAYTKIEMSRVCNLFFVKGTESTMPHFCKCTINKTPSYQDDIITVDKCVIDQGFVYGVGIIESCAEARTWVEHLLPSAAWLRETPIDILRHCSFTNDFRKFTFMNNEWIYIVEDVDSRFLTCITHRNGDFYILILLRSRVYFNINGPNPGTLASLQGHFVIPQRPIADYHQ